MLYFVNVGSQVQLRETWQFNGIDVPNTYKIHGTTIKNAHHDGRAVLLYKYYEKTGKLPDVEIPEKDIPIIQSGFEYLVNEQHKVQAAERQRFKEGR